MEQVQNLPRPYEIGQQIVEALGKREMQLRQEAERLEARLDAQVEEKRLAVSELPGLYRLQSEKENEVSRLTTEIESLQERIAIAEQVASDNEQNAFSRIARTRQDWQAAVALADSYVADKARELTQ